MRMNSPRFRRHTSNIFISYRRDDAGGYAHSLFERLHSRFGHRTKIFMDIDTLSPGEDFVKAIYDAIETSVALIVVIGKRWLSATDETGMRRLDDPQDYVRLEIAIALKRGIRVIPVLVQGAIMPRPQDLPDDLAELTRRNAFELSDNRWRYDVDRLKVELRKHIKPIWRRVIRAAVVTVGLIALLGLWWWLMKPPERTLTYGLTIRPQSDGQETRATGLEMFAAGSRFRFKATPEQAGALYLINEGPSTNGNGSWHTLFPTPANNQGDARVAPRQTIETREYEFTGASGMEKIWIVWANQRIALLDDIVRQSISTDLSISDPSQQAELLKFLEANRTPPPEVVTDKKQLLVTLKGRGEVFVFPLELRHTK